MYETIRGMLPGCNASVINRKHWLLVCFVFFTMTALHAQHQRVLIANIMHDTNDVYMPAGKLETGLTIALEATGKYGVISTHMRDSALKGRTDSVTIQKVAEMFNAELILFCQSNRIGKLVRSEVVLMGGDNFFLNVRGIGYGVSTIEDQQTKKMIMDPAILSSLQRALCVALKDSNLYANADSLLRVRPTYLAAVGGFEFKQPPSNLAPWSIFKEKILASYDAAQITVAALQDRDDITMVDVDTRDSMYARERLYMVEPYNPTNRSERYILRSFEVTHLVAGTISRTADGAECSISLQKINDHWEVETVKTGATTVTKDTRSALQDAVRESLRKIFGSINEPQVPSR